MFILITHLPPKAGEIIKGHSSDRVQKLGNLSEANESPIPIEVEYLPNKPEINRIKGMTGQANTVGEFLWRRIGLGLLLLIVFSTIGFGVIKNAIRKYKVEKRKLPDSI